MYSWSMVMVMRYSGKNADRIYRFLVNRLSDR
jgi:hypothetical protein